MTFYEEVRAFFKKYDPARVRLARKIAAIYKTPKAQKAALKRLKEVYAAGGPDKFDFKAVAPSLSKPVAKVEKIEEEVAAKEIEMDDISDELPEVGE
ncbi:MAG: hypothetical protein H6600_02045 [Flavobacteriales bacterium]|nr:hypothetical protein [Flavobacteriales bacterium]MCB9197212.1 hypothetical protein [Flavobacteriales bacterium]